MTVQAILFDAAGTLIRLPRGVGWHYREVAARHGMALEETRISAAFATAFKAAPPRVSTGVSRPDDDKLWWWGLVRRVLAECGEQPDEEEFGAYFEELYGHFAQPGVWELYPEAIPVLEALRPRYRLGIVSNFDRRLYAILDHLGIRHYFEAVILSSEAGIDKPDPRIFAAALSLLDTVPGRTIHAGDHPEQDWRGAEEAGLLVYRVDRPARGLEGLPGFADAHC